MGGWFSSPPPPIPTYCQEIHMTDYVMEKWKDHHDYFEFCFSCGVVCIRKIDNEEEWPIAIEHKARGSDQWFVQIREVNHIVTNEWKKSTFQWHIGAALYICHQFAKSRPQLNSSDFARGIVASMKEEGPKEGVLTRVNRDLNLFAWARQARIDLFIRASPED